MFMVTDRLHTLVYGTKCMVCRVFLERNRLNGIKHVLLIPFIPDRSYLLFDRCGAGKRRESSAKPTPCQLLSLP